MNENMNNEINFEEEMNYEANESTEATGSGNSGLLVKGLVVVAGVVGAGVAAYKNRDKIKAGQEKRKKAKLERKAKKAGYILLPDTKEEDFPEDFFEDEVPAEEVK